MLYSVEATEVATTVINIGKKDYDEFSLEQYMAWILKTAIWNTVKDIDNICLELAKQQKAINKLPIKLDENTSVKVFSKKEYIGDRKAFDNSDDDVSTLLELIQ